MAHGRPRPQRLKELEELLDIYYGRLHNFEVELGISTNVDGKNEIRQRIKREISPEIERYETEYAQILVQATPEETIPDATANELVTEISRAADSLEKHVTAGSPESTAIRELKAELSKSGSASAKLKLSLPIVPLIVSYEITLETAGLMGNAWRRIKETFAHPH